MKILIIEDEVPLANTIQALLERKKLASIGSNIRIEAVRRLGYHLEVDGSC